MDKIIFSGNVGRDVDYSEKDGRGMARFSVAVTHRIKGEKATEWRSVTAFGKTAEFCKMYVTKGRTVLIEGRPSARVYKNKLEENVATIDVLIDNVELMGGPKEDSANPAGAVVVDNESEMPF